MPLYAFAVLALSATFVVQSPPSRADILRGEYGRYRANNDLRFYHLDIRVDPEKKFFSGKNTIRFKMLKEDTRIQMELFSNYTIEKIVMDAQVLNEGASRLPGGARAPALLAKLGRYDVATSVWTSSNSRRDARGPSIAIDTACSSSLVAFDQACRAVLGGTSRTALCGGVNALVSPYHYVGFSQASMLSPTGRCRPGNGARPPIATS